MSVKNQDAHLIDGHFLSKSNLIKLKDQVIDLIFPPMCLSCGRVDERWCTSCLDELVNLPIQVKDFSPQILNALSATGKHLGQLQLAIQSMKYHQTQELAKPLGTRIVLALQQKDWTFDTIIPVPLFQDRLQKRGYNQAYLLSQQVEQSMKIACQPQFLKRFRDTNQQVGLNAQERRNNVKDAFIATDDVRGKSILLIDDVVTTGATLDACAIALLNKGATTVSAFTVSHA